MEERNKKFEMSETDKTSLKDSIKALGTNKDDEEILLNACNEILEGLKIQLLPSKEGGYEPNFDLFKGKIPGWIDDILDKFVEKTYLIANGKVLFALFKELIDHQLRIVQYYRLFAKLGFAGLSEEQRSKIERIDEALKVHDSDKLEDEKVIKYYILQQILGEIAKRLPDGNCKIIFNKIAATLRRIHGDNSIHHVEYYNLNESKRADITPSIILEHVLDVLAIGDKRSEIPGQFYEEFKDKSLKAFSEKFNGLITYINKVFKDEILSKTTELKKLKEARNEEEISKETEEIVWQKLDSSSRPSSPVGTSRKVSSDDNPLRVSSSFDSFNSSDDTMRSIKEINKNLYFAIEKGWDDKDKDLKHFTLISKYKKEIFENNVDLIKHLQEAVKSTAENEDKLIEVSALLETLKTLQDKKESEIIEEFKDDVVKKFLKNNEANLESKMNYIRRRNESEDGKNFYVGRVG